MSSVPIMAQEEGGEQPSPLGWAETQLDLGFGGALPLLFSDEELLRSKELRASGQSYFERVNGSRAGVGSYPALSGISLGLSFHKPSPLLDGLMFGGAVKMTLAGSQPTLGGYEEAYFFNFLQAAASVKYYPFRLTPFYLATDVGLGAVFTKNRFLSEIGEQLFFHQFGIGVGGNFSAGYSFTILRETRITIAFQYEWYQTRVEVNGIGDDMWTFGALSAIVKIGL